MILLWSQLTLNVFLELEHGSLCFPSYQKWRFSKILEVNLFMINRETTVTYIILPDLIWNTINTTLVIILLSLFFGIKPWHWYGFELLQEILNFLSLTQTPFLDNGIPGRLFMGTDLRVMVRSPQSNSLRSCSWGKCKPALI